MKRIIVFSGFLAAIMILIGSFFKLLHWQHAYDVLAIGSAVFAFIFIPVFFIGKMMEEKRIAIQIIYVFEIIAIIFITVGLYFKILHFPGGGFILFIGTILFSIASLFLAINYYKQNGFEKKYEMILTIVVVLAGSMLMLEHGLNYGYNVIMSTSLLDEKIEDIKVIEIEFNKEIIKELSDSNACNYDMSIISEFKKINIRLHETILEIKNQMILISDGRVDKTKLESSENISGKDDLSASSIVMFTKNMDKELINVINKVNKLFIKGTEQFQIKAIPFYLAEDLNKAYWTLNSNNTSWTEVHFENAPLINAIAHLDMVELEIYSTENRFFREIRKKINNCK